MKIQYKISEINLDEGRITVDYSIENHPGIDYKIGFELPIKDGQYQLGDDLEHAILKHAPAKIFQRQLDTKYATNVADLAALLGTAGNVIADPHIRIGARDAMKFLR
jgi:hypothetical protein